MQAKLPIFLAVSLASPIRLSAQVQEAWVSEYRMLLSITALAVDGSGDIFATGSGYDPVSDTSGYVTVRCDTNGNQLWTARYTWPTGHGNAPIALVLDRVGNIYVTGNSQNNIPDTNGLYHSQFATVKYDGQGNELWTARYGGPTDDANPSAFAVDKAGNVYITGLSLQSLAGPLDFATVKYDSNGNLLWVARFDAQNGDGNSRCALAVDNAGNVYVTGFSHGGYTTLKYDLVGNQVWVGYYQNLSGVCCDRPSAIAVDEAGNVYVTGSSAKAGLVTDYATVKYDVNGSQLWVARYDGPANHGSSATGLVLDPTCNIYVTGYSAELDFGTDFATVKYDTNAHELWVATYDGPGHGNESASNDYAAQQILLDAAGNIYVGGSSQGLGTGFDFAVVKYDTNGNQQWVARYNSQTNSDDIVTALALDGQGNVYVAGYSYDPGFAWDDRVIVKYEQTLVAPRLSFPTLLAAGQFQFTLIGVAGTTYEIQTSSDLVNWTALTNFVSATGTNQLTDGAAPGFVKRFYRAVAQ